MICRDIKAKPLSFVIQRLLLHLYPENKNDYKKAYKPDALLRLLGHLNIVYKSINKVLVKSCQKTLKQNCCTF